MAHSDAILSSVALSPVQEWFVLAGVSGKLQCSAAGALLKIRSIRRGGCVRRLSESVVYAGVLRSIFVCQLYRMESVIRRQVTVTSIKDGGVFFTISFRSGRLVGRVVCFCTRPGVTRGRCPSA